MAKSGKLLCGRLYEQMLQGLWPRILPFPSELTWICSSHFVGGKKCNDPTSPAYTPSLFSHVRSPVKRKAADDLRRFCRLREAKRRRKEGFFVLKSEERISNELESNGSVEGLDDVVQYGSSCIMTDFSVYDLTMARMLKYCI